MRCSEELLWSYVDGELPPEERKALEEHLKLCPECRRELSLMMEMERALSEEPIVSPDPRFTEKIMSRIMRSGSSSGRSL